MGLPLGGNHLLTSIGCPEYAFPISFELLCLEVDLSNSTESLRLHGMPPDEEEASTFLSSSPKLSYPFLSTSPRNEGFNPRAHDMDNDTASDVTHDSLADSTYEIISAANTRSSDDEESHQDDTDSMLSYDEQNHTNLDASVHQEYVSPEASRAITPALDPSDDEDDDVEEVGYTDTARPFRPSIGQSDLTENTVLQTPRASVTFDPSMIEDDEETIIHEPVNVLTTYFNSGAPLRQPQVAIQHTLSANPLEVSRAFRILWHGDSEERDTVVYKLGQAIATSGVTSAESSILKETSSRFSIVPLSSYDSKETPNITIIPGGKDITVDECRSCQAQLKDMSQPIKHLHSHTDYDLEIFFHSQTTQQQRTFDAAKMHTSAPFLDIRKSRSAALAYPIVPCYNKAVHMRLDFWRPPHPAVVSIAPGDAIPIELDHFADIDPVMLNRNLRCLMDHRNRYDSQIRRKATYSNLEAGYTSLKEAIEGLTGRPFWRVVVASLLTIFLYGMLMRSAVSIASQGEHSPPTSNAVPTPIDRTQTVTQTLVVQETSVEQVTVSVQPINTSTVPALASSTPPGTRALGSPLKDAHPQPASKFDLLRTEEGKLYLKLPHEMAKLRRPPPINVTAYTGSTQLEAVLSKWNASVYSLELKNADFRLPITIEVDSEKASGMRQTFHIDPRNPWRGGLRSLESGLSACFETTKDVARVAQKELGLFRDHANGLILSSSAWLHTQMENVRHRPPPMSDFWERLSQRRDLIATFVDRGTEDILEEANRRAMSVTTALSKRITAVTEASKQLEKSLVKHTHAGTQNVRECLRHLPRMSSIQQIAVEPLKEARHRARILALKASAIVAPQPTSSGTPQAADPAEDVRAKRAAFARRAEKAHRKVSRKCKYGCKGKQ